MTSTGKITHRRVEPGSAAERIDSPIFEAVLNDMSLSDDVIEALESLEGTDEKDREERKR